MTQGATELHYLTIGEASELLKNGKLSPVELTQAFLDRIDELDEPLQAYITLLTDSAMSEARKVEAEIQRGDYKGPLHGVPIALKDLYDTKGFEGIPMDEFRVIVQRAGFSLTDEELESLKPMYDLYAGPIAEMHKLDMAAEDLAVVFAPDWDPE